MKGHRLLQRDTEEPSEARCSCQQRSALVLMEALEPNPLHCLDCGKKVEPHSLPFSDSLFEGIARWLRVADAVDKLWLDSGEYEDWALKELSSPTSYSNRKGQEQCAAINLVAPCYFSLFQNTSDDTFRPHTSCPNCDRELSQGTFRGQSIGLCSHCKLLLFT